MKPTTDLGCSYEMSWELQPRCYTECDESEDIGKLSFLSKRLAELERSLAVFKDLVLDFFELLIRGFGTIKASHHNHVSVDLGISDAQCQILNARTNQLAFLEPVFPLTNKTNVILMYSHSFMRVNNFFDSLILLL